MRTVSPPRCALPHTLPNPIEELETVDLTNQCYVISISTKNSTEKYYRDQTGWVKVSARGRTFRATAEQVLNHLLPALAGVKPNVTVRVEHRDTSRRDISS